MEDFIRDLKARREKALKMGGAEKVTRQHARGRLTARERIERLLDTNSFVELGMFNHSDGNPRSFACNEIS